MSIMKEKSHKCVAVGSGKATTSKTGAVITIPHKSHATSTSVTKNTNVMVDRNQQIQ